VELVAGTSRSGLRRGWHVGGGGSNLDGNIEVIGRPVGETAAYGSTRCNVVSLRHRDSGSGRQAALHA